MNTYTAQPIRTILSSLIATLMTTLIVVSICDRDSYRPYYGTEAQLSASSGGLVPDVRLAS